MDLKSRAFIRATARASPMAMVASVDVVGARLFGQISLSTATFRVTSACFANVDLLFPVTAMMVLEKFLHS